MVYDLLTLETYFEQYNGLFGIADFCFGDTENILDRKNKQIRYPCLWLEVIDEDIDDFGHSKFNIRLTLQAIAANIPDTDEKILKNDMRKTLLKVLKKMREDSPTHIVHYKTKAQIYYKDRFSGDDEILAMVETQVGGVLPPRNYLD